MEARERVKLLMAERMLDLVKTLGREVTCDEAATLAGISRQQAGPTLKRLVRCGQLIARQAEKKGARFRVIPVSYYRWAGELSPHVPSWFPRPAVTPANVRKVQGRDAWG